MLGNFRERNALPLVTRLTVVNAFIIRDVSRNSCTTCQWLCWIQLFTAISVELKTL